MIGPTGRKNLSPGGDPDSRIRILVTFHFITSVILGNLLAYFRYSHRSISTTHHGEMTMNQQRLCDVYVGGKVRVAKFMMSWNLQLK